MLKTQPLSTIVASVFLSAVTFAADIPADAILKSQAAPFSFVYDGKSSQSLLANWKLASSESPNEPGCKKTVTTYSDPATGLDVVCEMKQFTDFPAVEWVLRFRNSGSSDTPILEKIRPLDLGITLPKEFAANDDVILHRSRGSTCVTADFLPADDAMPAGTEINLAAIGGRSSDGSMPFFNLQWHGGGMVGAIGWTGQWAMRVSRPDSDHLAIEAGQQTTRFKLLPGETVRTPRILLLTWQGDDAMRGNNLLRRLLAAHYAPRRNNEIVMAPLAWHGWFAFNEGNGVNEQNQLDWIDRIAKLGADGYWLDAGWFEGGWPKGAGNLAPGASQFPQGLRPLGDAVHRNGMKFILWFEPERATGNSAIAREHPKWILHVPNEKRVSNILDPTDGLLNLGEPAARRWLTDEISKRLVAWGVDVFRIDCNIDLECFWRAADAPDRQGISEIRYIEGLYEFWDELVRRQPALVIDNCASGGRRIDLETLSRSYTLSRSDTSGWEPGMGGHPVWDQVQSAGLSFYALQHTGGLWSFDPYAFRSTVTTCAATCLDARAADGSVALAKAAFDEARQLRPYYFGDYYPLTEINLDPQVWCGWQYDRPELGGGFAMLFRRPKAANAAIDVKLRGVDPAAQYEVEFRGSYETKEKHTLDGKQLQQLRVEIDSAPGSMLVLYRKLP